MSGGSFNYLCFRDDEAEALERRGDLVEMAEELGRLAPEHPVTKYTQALAKKASIGIPQEVKDVWYEVEWWRSCDHSLDQVEDALEKTKGWSPCVSPD